jgi:hypothetical protein
MALSEGYSALFFKGHKGLRAPWELWLSTAGNIVVGMAAIKRAFLVKDSLRSNPNS